MGNLQIKALVVAAGAAAALLLLFTVAIRMPARVEPVEPVEPATLEASADSDIIRIAAIGDFGNNLSAEASVAAEVASWNVDLVITLGDNRYESWSYDAVIGQYYCSFLRDVQSGAYCSGGTATLNAFFPAASNHDYSDGEGIDEYLDYFQLPGSGITSTATSGSERYYDFIVDDVQFFAIDSQAALNDAAEMNAQKTWLQNQLAASTATWQIVYFHHAAYSSANHGSNTDMQWPFAAWGADAVISGHDHVYERIFQDGIVYFVNGTGGRYLYSFGTPIAGSQFRYNSKHGAMLIQAAAGILTFEFINEAGKSIDAYSLGQVTNESLNTQINSGADDVEEQISSGAIYSTSTDLELGSDVSGANGPQLVGLRFQHIDIPAGAAIIAAFIELETDETSTTATQVTIQAQASGNAESFTNNAYDLSLRSRTRMSVTWDIPAWNSSSERHRSPDLSNLIQVLVDREDWDAFNAIVIIIAGTGRRTAESYDGESDAAPILYAEFTLPRPFGVLLPLVVDD